MEVDIRPTHDGNPHILKSSNPKITTFEDSSKRQHFGGSRILAGRGCQTVSHLWQEMSSYNTSWAPCTIQSVELLTTSAQHSTSLSVDSLTVRYIDNADFVDDDLELEDENNKVQKRAKFEETLVAIVTRTILAFATIPLEPPRVGNCRNSRPEALQYVRSWDDDMFRRQFRLCREDFGNLLMKISPMIERNARLARRLCKIGRPSYCKINQLSEQYLCTTKGSSSDEDNIA